MTRIQKYKQLLKKIQSIEKEKDPKKALRKLIDLIKQNPTLKKSVKLVLKYVKKKPVRVTVNETDEKVDLALELLIYIGCLVIAGIITAIFTLAHFLISEKLYPNFLLHIVANSAATVLYVWIRGKERFYQLQQILQVANVTIASVKIATKKFTSAIPRIADFAAYILTKVANIPPQDKAKIYLIANIVIKVAAAIIESRA